MGPCLQRLNDAQTCLAEYKAMNPPDEERSEVDGAWYTVFEKLTMEFFKRMQAQLSHWKTKVPKPWAEWVKKKNVTKINEKCFTVAFNNISIGKQNLVGMFSKFRDFKFINKSPLSNHAAWLKSLDGVKKMMTELDNYVLSMQACNLIIRKWPKEKDATVRSADLAESSS